MNKTANARHQAPFHPLRIQLGCALIGLTAASLVAYATLSKQGWILEWWMELLLSESLVVMKWAAPAVPWKQMGACIVTVWAIHVLFHFLGEHVFVPLFFLADRIGEVVCVFGFGRYWVKRGYIPSWANA